MTEQKQVKILKMVMIAGVCLILIGHYLLSYTDFTETHGITGFMISAGCIAFGLILSLPTKMYLTFVFVKNENDHNPKLADLDENGHHKAESKS